MQRSPACVHLLVHISLLSAYNEKIIPIQNRYFKQGIGIIPVSIRLRARLIVFHL